MKAESPSPDGLVLLVVCLPSHIITYRVKKAGIQRGRWCARRRGCWPCRALRRRLAESWSRAPLAGDPSHLTLTLVALARPSGRCLVLLFTLSHRCFFLPCPHLLIRSLMVLRPLPSLLPCSDRSPSPPHIRPSPRRTSCPRSCPLFLPPASWPRHHPAALAPPLLSLAAPAL